MEERERKQEGSNVDGWMKREGRRERKGRTSTMMASKEELRPMQSTTTMLMRMG